MPIHDLGYRHWAGEWTSHPYRWWVITSQGIRLLIQKKRFLVLMFLSAIPFLVRTVFLYVSTITTNLPSDLLRITPKFFEDFLSQQMWFFAFAIAIYSGAGLIANDLKANALQIYLSKPITRRDYLIGKLGVLVFFLALPTLVPGLLLFLLAVLFQPSLEFLKRNYWVPGAITAYSLLIIFTFALVILALSSLSRSSRFAGINFAAVLFFSQILAAILGGILRTSKLAWVSLMSNLTQVGDFLFRNPPQHRSAVWISMLVLLLLMAGSTWVIHRRVRAVEVVK
jgi:ABC-2 type transport system permease protein